MNLCTRIILLLFPLTVSFPHKPHILCLLPLWIYWLMQLMFLPPLLDDGSYSPLLLLSKHARKLGEPQLPFSEQQNLLGSYRSDFFLSKDPFTETTCIGKRSAVVFSLMAVPVIKVGHSWGRPFMFCTWISNGVCI